MFKVLISLFGERKPKASEQKRISATLYPDRINIDTFHKVKAGYWTSKADVTILAEDISNDELGAIIRKHLELTRYNLKDRTQYEFKEATKAFVKAHGFKTMKALYANAKHLSVSATDQEIKVEPNVNGGSSGEQRGFRGIDTQSTCSKWRCR
ncbi:contact-dependent growth inhibition system immunity protein [Pedobacter sp. ASV28]|uniref:contact-dependent growth inhibition system immunity protein n=1 Tax=Pedobacter sp. ASV28 TaxID=2795123 RepID=UPI0018ECC0DC|nr:contact-dependent growth inhibition system immunity protein [Pedobacter sp. ASV28]